MGLSPLYGYLSRTSRLTFGPGRTSVHAWHSPGSVVAPGRLSPPRWRPESLLGKPMPAAGKTVHVRRLSRRPITVRCTRSPAPSGGPERSPAYGRRLVVAMEGCEPLSRRMWGRRPGRPGECPPNRLSLVLSGSSDAAAAKRQDAEGSSLVINAEGGFEMDITFKGRHTNVPERFQRHATARSWPSSRGSITTRSGLTSRFLTERNPRQADRSERVELTVRSKGPRPSGPRRRPTTCTRPLTSRSPNSKASCARRPSGARPGTAT